MNLSGTHITTVVNGVAIVEACHGNTLLGHPQLGHELNGQRTKERQQPQKCAMPDDMLILNDTRLLQLLHFWRNLLVWHILGRCLLPTASYTVDIQSALPFNEPVYLSVIFICFRLYPREFGFANS